MRLLPVITALGSVLCTALMAAPNSVGGQSLGCGWCEVCPNYEQRRVYDDSGCLPCHRDKDLNLYSQECHYVTCADYEGCTPEEEDADYEAIELLARDLKSDDPGTVMASLDAYGPRLTLSEERRGILLFDGCRKDLILAFIPVSNSTLEMALEAGLKTTDAYLAALIIDG